MIKKCIGWFLIGLGIGFILGTLFNNFYKATAVSAQACKVLNANCINASDHSCCSGLSCQNGQGGYKCRTTVIPTNTPIPTATPTVACRIGGIDCSHDWQCCSDDCHSGHCRAVPTSTPTPTNVPTQSPTPTPTDQLTPTPTPTEQPKGDGNPAPQVGVLENNTTNPPVCNDGTVLKLPANFFVERKGSEAILKWIPTEGSQVNVFYKLVESSGWQFALADQPNNGNLTIGMLNPALGYTFGLMQKNGCGSGTMATSVVVDGSESRIFRMNYWQWE